MGLKEEEQAYWESMRQILKDAQQPPQETPHTNQFDRDCIFPGLIQAVEMHPKLLNITSTIESKPRIARKPYHKRSIVIQQQPFTVCHCRHSSQYPDYAFTFLLLHVESGRSSGLFWNNEKKQIADTPLLSLAVRMRLPDDLPVSMPISADQNQVCPTPRLVKILHQQLATIPLSPDAARITAPFLQFDANTHLAEIHQWIDQLPARAKKIRKACRDTSNIKQPPVRSRKKIDN